jgi:hypothetical protein
MKRHPPVLLLSMFALAAVGSATAGSVTVSFAEPIAYTTYQDAGNTRWQERANLQALADHLQALGQRYLPADQALKVELLDVDLAGSTHASRRSGYDFRVVRGRADWPRVNVRYSLEAGGKPVQSGEEWVTDMGYAHGFVGVRRAEALHYEKRMLEAWFKSRFVERQLAGG